MAAQMPRRKAIFLHAADGGKLLSIPYSQEINDIPAIIARSQEAATFASMIEDAVTQLQRKRLK